MTANLRSPAILYVRWSSDSQKDGSSYERQTGDAGKTFCARHGLTLTRTIVDAGISGALGNNLRNGKFALLVAEARAKLLPPGLTILMDDPTRLSRAPPREVMRYVDELIYEHGLKVGFVSTGKIYDSSMHWMDELPLRMSCGMGFEENLERTRKVRRGKTEARLDAIRHHKALTKWRRGWLDIKDGGYVVNPAREKIVVRIFTELLVDGKELIARRFNEEGVPPFVHNDINYGKRGKPSQWQPSYIAKMIENKAVLGHFYPVSKNLDTNKKPIPTGEVIPDFYPRVIDDELYERVELAIARRQKTGGPRSERVANIFRNLGVCAFCSTPTSDGPMVGRDSGIRRRAVKRPRASRGARDYLICRTAKRGKCANKQHYSIVDAERHILDALGRMILPHTDTRAEITSLENRRGEARAVLNAVKKRYTALATDFSGAFSADALGTLKAEAERRSTEVERLSQELAERRASPDPQDQHTAVRQLVTQVRGGNVDARKKVAAALRLIVTKIVFTDAHKVIVVLNEHRGKHYSFSIDPSLADPLQWFADSVPLGTTKPTDLDNFGQDFMTFIRVSQGKPAPNCPPPEPTMEQWLAMLIKIDCPYEMLPSELDFPRNDYEAD